MIPPSASAMEIEFRFRLSACRYDISMLIKLGFYIDIVMPALLDYNEISSF